MRYGKAFGLVPRKVDVYTHPASSHAIHYDNKCIVIVDNSKVHGVGCRNMVSVTFFSFVTMQY